MCEAIMFLKKRTWLLVLVTKIFVTLLYLAYFLSLNFSNSGKCKYLNLNFKMLLSVQFTFFVRLGYKVTYHAKKNGNLAFEV